MGHLPSASLNLLSAGCSVKPALSSSSCMPCGTQSSAGALEPSSCVGGALPNPSTLESPSCNLSKLKWLMCDSQYQSFFHVNLRGNSSMSELPIWLLWTQVWPLVKKCSLMAAQQLTKCEPQHSYRPSYQSKYVDTCQSHPQSFISLAQQYLPLICFWLDTGGLDKCEAGGGKWNFLSDVEMRMRITWTKRFDQFWQNLNHVWKVTRI